MTAPRLWSAYPQGPKVQGRGLLEISGIKRHTRQTRRHNRKVLGAGLSRGFWKTAGGSGQRALQVCGAARFAGVWSMAMSRRSIRRSSQHAGHGATGAGGVLARRAVNASRVLRSVSVRSCMSQVTTQVGPSVSRARRRRRTISICWAIERRSRIMGSTSSSSSSQVILLVNTERHHVPKQAADARRHHRLLPDLLQIGTDLVHPVG